MQWPGHFIIYRIQYKVWLGVGIIKGPPNASYRYRYRHSALTQEWISKKPIPAPNSAMKLGSADQTKKVHSVGIDRFNDPSAGSPTETLLRLLLPLGGRV